MCLFGSCLPIFLYFTPYPAGLTSILCPSTSVLYHHHPMNSLLQTLCSSHSCTLTGKTRLGKDTLRTARDSGEGSNIFLSLTGIPEMIIHQFSTLVHNVKPELPKVTINTSTFTVSFPGSVLLSGATLQLPSCALESTCNEALMSELISWDSE